MVTPTKNEVSVNADVTAKAGSSNNDLEADLDSDSACSPAQEVIDNSEPLFE